MKTNKSIRQLIISCIIGATPTAFAGTIKCYVQAKAAESNNYQNVLATVTFDESDSSNHIVLEETDDVYSARIENGVLTIGFFKKSNPYSPLLVVAKGSEMLTVLNDPAQRLMSCTQER